MTLSGFRLSVSCSLLLASAATVAGCGSAQRSACSVRSNGASNATMPTSGDFPLSVSVRPLFIGPKGGGTYEIALTDNAPRSVPRACLTIIQQTHGLASTSRPTPSITNGGVRGLSSLKTITGADGPSYEALVRAPRVGRQIKFRILATPATVQNPGLTCLLVGALVPQANPSNAINNGVQGSFQVVCTFPGKKPPALLPIQLSLGGPSRTHTGSVGEYTVTVRNLSAQPLHDIGIGINQPDLPKFPAIAVQTDYGLKHGRKLRKEVKLTTLGSSPITFHLWWRARGPQRATNGQSVNMTTFGVAAYDRRTYPNPSEIIYTTLLSPLTTQ